MALVVGVLLGSGYYLVSNWRESGDEDQGGGDSSSSTAIQPDHQRPAHPSWVPADWELAVNGAMSTLFISGDKPEGGRCDSSDDVLKVTRSDNRDLTGCIIQPGSALDRNFTDLAVEAEVTVDTGCAGLWARTGSQGYFLTICDKTASLYLLGDAPPSTSNRLAGEWTFGYRPTAAIAGLLVRGTTIEVYLCGKRLGSVSDSHIPSGKADAGGYAGTKDSTVNVSISDFRIYAPGVVVTATSPAPAASPVTSKTKKATTSQDPSGGDGSSPYATSASSSW